MVRSVIASFTLFLLLNLLPTAGFGQKIKPLGLFLNDSIEVGKPVYFSLSVRHDPKTEIFFPDTLYDFSPFEIISKRAFTSSTDDRGSLDSAVYQLISFDVARSQSLKMPVYVFNKKDCTAVFTKPDSVFLIKSNVVEAMKTAKLVPETSLLPLSSEFNFSILLGSIALIIGVVGSIYWVFGQDIYKQWQLIKLQRRHLEYVRSFNRLMRNAREKNNIKDAEKAIIVWKNYLERLEKKPFATYTTREIVDNMPDEALAEALKNMDSIIYGQVISKNMAESLEVLKSGATRIYRNKRRFILDSPIA
ncbi:MULTISPECIES: hypothetical protein [Dyadobacter]|uniref:Uncharacterized protein n=1 Tax=Dyadobacter chenhuakuii TaxID=2909339 RepID=A0A9X1TUV2_9BACT|nr:MULTISPECIES: hypothetical protein [Dyadobacter]MCE7068700.1 hypothetical protein [Dyadobacter sp. CY327]MCF2499763.1 hypothetical protein [Dyadobacter chenhuakuii]MCF2520968.1 hypothetical protein [Dyadobacter sp. CY351]